MVFAERLSPTCCLNLPTEKNWLVYSYPIHLILRQNIMNLWAEMLKYKSESALSATIHIVRIA